ncbi:hypothetical protein E4656_12805 [Natronospirillum operosum]|uniref:PilN domain-containing protein n=1 Tax=Natronospirillum operosum TaxID=2759953 RepID=A0A4Z0W717_9GAMM|nr:hypothetical protein [Natronospirillum operosum]TGG92352.1 hypothetical protein E4656_12805 [Natronospirillum operosum]
MQRINLCTDRPAGRRLYAGHLMLLLAAAVCVAVLVTLWQQQQYHERQQVLAAAEADAERAREELEAFRAAYPQLQNTEALEAEISELEQRRTERRQLLTNLQRSTGARPYSYHAFLRTLSTQRLDGVWLTAFSLDNPPEQDQVRVSLRGRAVAAELLPRYLDRLREGEAARLSFDVLDLDRMTSDTGEYRFVLETRSAESGEPRQPQQSARPELNLPLELDLPAELQRLLQ